MISDGPSVPNSKSGAGELTSSLCPPQLRRGSLSAVVGLAAEAHFGRQEAPVGAKTSGYVPLMVGFVVLAVPFTIGRAAAVSSDGPAGGVFRRAMTWTSMPTAPPALITPGPVEPAPGGGLHHGAGLA